MKRKMVLSIVLIFALAIAAILAFAATRPDTFEVARSIGIAAPAEKIFAQIDDFHNWRGWAPQDMEDTSMRRTYSGAASGKGAVSEWESTGSAGTGRMEIVESAPYRKIAVKVDFAKPFEAHNLNEFTLEPDGATTKVTWTMRGSNVYLMKVMSVFVSMDKMAGKHFEAGLANLKRVAER